MISRFFFLFWVFFFQGAIRFYSLFSPKVKSFLRERTRNNALDVGRILKLHLQSPIQLRVPPTDPSTEERILKNRVWFHAASQGEFEGLLPVLKRLSLAENPPEIIFTVFSLSVLKRALQLPEEFKPLGFLFVGASPLEGEWKASLRLYRPAVFVSYKYEAWPELWHSLQSLAIPLWIVAATPRKSLKWMARLSRRLYLFRLPKLYFFTLSEAGRITLLKWFPKNSEAEVLSDFRWDRQKDLLEEKIAKGIGDDFSWIKSEAAARPIVALGSVYLNDLKVLFPSAQIEKLNAIPVRATFFIFPHRLESENLEEIRKFLEKIPIIYHLVAKPGLLSSFYSHADLVWVGGGYNNGIHSTIQPGYSGVPIFCGPKNAGLFPETEFLAHIGQLRICRTPEVALEFWKKIKEWNEENDPRPGFRAQITECVGGADLFAKKLICYLESLSEENRF